MAELWPFSPWKVAWFHWEAHGTKQDPLVFICSKKIQNRPRNGWVIGISSLRGCVIPLGSRWDKRGSFGAHLYQKDPKYVKKWLNYGHFLPERLSNSIVNHMGQSGILWCSFVPKRSKIGQEMAELWPFSPWEVAWFHWEAHGTKGDPLVFICTQKIQNRTRNGWVKAIFSLERLSDSIDKHIIAHASLHNCEW